MTELGTHLFYIAIIFTATAFILLSERIRVRHYIILDNAIPQTSNIYCQKNRHKYIPFLLKISAFAIVAIPLITRSELCGADTATYYMRYVYGSKENFDYLFFFALKLLHFVIPDPKMGLGVVSLITLGLAFYSFSLIRDKIDTVYCYFAYFTCLYFYTYNYMRIMLATSFILIGYALIILGKRKKALIPFAIASGIHMSAIVVFAIGIVIMLFYKDIKILSGIICFGTVLFLLMPGTFFALVSVDRYIPFINAINVKDVQIGVGTTLRVLSFLFIYLFQFNKFKHEKTYKLFGTMIMANWALSFLGYYVGVASRISNMYFVFHILYYVPWALRRTQSRGSRMILKIFAVFYCLLLYYFIAQNFRAMRIIPYR